MSDSGREWPSEQHDATRLPLENDLRLMRNQTDPVFCLESLNRFLPTAAFSMTMDSGSTQPHVKVTAGMRDTSNAVSKGYGAWVRFDDVLRLMIALKDQGR